MNRKKIRRQKRGGTLPCAVQALALAGLLMTGQLAAGTVAGTTGLAFAASPITITDNHQVADDATEEYTTINVNGGGTLGIARNAKVVGTDVTVGAGGTITSAKNLHIGTPGSGQANTGLRANTLTLGGTSANLGQARALHLSLFTDGLVTINQYGKLTLDSINNDTASTWGGGKLTINGGTLDIANLSIAYDKLVGTDTAGSLILTNGGQFTVRDTLSITGDSFTNTLGGGIQAGKLVMESGKSYIHNTGAALRLTGMTTDGSFYTGDTFTVSQGKVFFGAEGNSPFRNHTTTATIAVGGTGSLEVAHGNWKTGAVTQTGGTININSKGVMVVDSLNQTGGLFTVGGSVNSGKLVVNGAVGNVAYSAGSAGINVRGTGALDVQYSQLVNAAGNDFLNTGTQKAINLEMGGMLNLSGYTGPGMNLTDFGTLTGKLLVAGSKGTVSGVTITGVTDTTALQDVANAHAAVPDAVVDGSGGISSGAAAVGGVKAGTSISGGASLALTGQGVANGMLANGNVTLDNGILSLGNAAGGSTGGTLTGDIDASGSSAANSINVVNGNYTVTGALKGGTGAETVTISGGSLSAGSIHMGSTDTISVGSESGAGALVAGNVSMGGGQINFDPPFVADGDTSNASMGGLTFAASTVDALMNVGQNSMVSLGSTDAEWLRSEVTRYQQDGKGLWGRDITAALALRAPQTLDATGGIKVDGTWKHGDASVLANSAIFADKSLLVVDAAGVGRNIALSGATGGSSTLTVDAGARLHIVGGQGGDTVNITGGFGASTKDGAAWTGDNLTTNTGLLSATGGTFNAADGTYSVTLSANAAKLIFPLLSDSMAGLVDSVFAQTRVNVHSPNAGVRFLSRATSDNFIGRTDTTKAAATIEGAAQMAVAGAVPGVTLSALNAATNAVTTRTSFASPLVDKSRAVAVHMDQSGNMSLDSGLSAGNSMKNGLGVWIMPLYQSENVWGMKAENFKTGYTSDLGGVALGADYTFADAFRVGLALNLGGGYAQSSGDFNKTDNSFNFWGVGLYGGWTQNNFGLTADVGYTSNYNKVKQELPQSMQMNDLKADVTSYAITAGLRGEYKFETSVLDIVPHISARYTSLNTDSYDVKSSGTVFEVDQAHQSLWTFPVGVTFSKDIETSGGWVFKPQVDLSVIPAAGDVKAKSKSRVPGVGSTAELETQVVDTFTWQGGLGFDMKSDNLSFGLNYNIQASEHRTGHGVFGTVRYEF